MKFKVIYLVKGKLYPAYYQTEKNAFEEIQRNSKHGYLVHTIERLSW